MFSSTKLLVHISHTCLEIYFLHELIFEVKCFRYIRDNEIIFLLLKNTHAHWHECQCACVFVHISARSPFPVHSCLFILLSLWLFLVKAFKTGFISIALIPKFTVGWFKLLHYIYIYFLEPFTFFLSRFMRYFDLLFNKYTFGNKNHSVF